jgi:RNA polymerase sigma-70 factor, ECF subfamily
MSKTMERRAPPSTDESAAEERRALERCRRGDTQAFGMVVRNYMKPAYFAALGLVGNREDALDLSQEAFVRAYRAISRFDPDKRFFTWYYRILRNLCMNYLRDRGRHRQVQFESEFELTAPRAAGDADHEPSVLAERNELVERLWAVMGGMKAEYREILMLREIEGCSYAEIAARLDVPPGTVMSRLHHARRDLKERMDRCP